MPVDLNRELPVSGMQFNPSNYYRMIGMAGWQDLQSAEVMRPRQDTGKHQQVFFMRGHALDRYRSRKGECDYIAEVSDPTVMKISPNGYPVATRSLGLHDVTVYRIDNATGQVTKIHSSL